MPPARRCKASPANQYDVSLDSQSDSKKSKRAQEDADWKAEEKERLNRVLENVDWSTEKDGEFFLHEFKSLINHWEKQLPKLREMFRPGETERFVSDCVKYIIDRGNYYNGIREFEVLTELVLPRRADSSPLHIICKDEYRNIELGSGKLHLGQSNLSDTTETFNVGLVEMFLHINGKLNEPVSIDTQDELGNAPLHLAILRSQKKMTEFLLMSDADPNLANEEGLTPLHLICRRHRDHYRDLLPQNQSLVELFFVIVGQTEKTLRLDARDKKGRTALQLAVENLLPQAVGRLLQIDADLSGFVFPTDFGEFVESFGRVRPVEVHDKVRRSFVHAYNGHQRNRLKFEAIVDAFAVVRRLNWKKYKFVRSDVLTMMRLFVECGLYELSVDLDDQQPWYDDEEVATTLKKVKVNNNRTLQDLMKLSLDEACEHYGYKDFLQTRMLYDNLSGDALEKLDARLGAILLRHLLKKFAEICCVTIVDNLTNKDLYQLCLAAAGESS